MIKVKICGVNDPAAFDAAVEAGADWIGFVFFPPSPRFVTPEQAHQLSTRSACGTPRVGLFVRPNPQEVLRTLDVVHLDILQLYGVDDRLHVFKEHFFGEMWRAVGVAAPDDLPTSPGGADRLVIEAKAPVGATRPGGNAVSFDWTITQRWKAPSPWILGGGLNTKNVSKAIADSAASAVDVSSGVEVSSGKKSPDLIRAFVQAAKAAASPTAET